MSRMQLFIGKVPDRQGTWLSMQDGTVWYALAKFRNEEAIEQFKRWVRASGISHDLGEEDGDSG